MSDQIKIGSGGSFPPTTANQSDMVFWYNSDDQPHYPIPLCEKLQVAPGATTPAFQPIQQPALPATITYYCARHSGESGTLEIDNDPTNPPSTQSAGPVSSTTKTIEIGAGGTFSEVAVLQSESVVWKNNDSETHWPVPNCMGLKVEPGATSNGTQIFPPPLLAPVAITYGCAMPGHESERGTINVYGVFVPVAAPGTLYVEPPWFPVPVATGGVSPYNITQDPAFPWLQAQEVPPGSSSGISVIVISKAPILTDGTINYQLTATDAQGTSVSAKIQIPTA
jgi:hypothetical protein